MSVGWAELVREPLRVTVGPRPLMERAAQELIAAWQAEGRSPERRS